MEIKVVIICAGEATRWGNYLNTPKHIITIEGECLLDSTVRLFKERGVTDIHIVVKQPDPRYEVTGASQYVADINYEDNADADKFLSSKALWSLTDRTIVVYGDIYLSDEGADKIVSYTNREWRLFCRPHASRITGTPWGDCFAQSFYPEHLEEHERALHRIAQLYKDGHLKRCGGWEHYREMCGVTKGFPRQRMVVIDDWSDDFDYPEDYERWITRWNKVKKRV